MNSCVLLAVRQSKVKKSAKGIKVLRETIVNCNSFMSTLSTVWIGNLKSGEFGSEYALQGAKWT